LFCGIDHHRSLAGSARTIKDFGGMELHRSVLREAGVAARSSAFSAARTLLAAMDFAAARSRSRSAVAAASARARSAFGQQLEAQRTGDRYGLHQPDFHAIAEPMRRSGRLAD